MLEIADLMLLISIVGSFFFILGVLVSPKVKYRLTKIMRYFVGPKYLIYRTHKTIKKMDPLR